MDKIIIKQIKKQLKEDLPNIDLRKVKLESININNTYIDFWYGNTKYSYNFVSKRTFILKWEKSVKLFL